MGFAVLSRNGVLNNTMTKKTKIGLITTLGTNIGDDFIRVGIQSVLRSFFSNRAVEWVEINKHDPQTVWPLRHPERTGRKLPSYLKTLAKSVWKNKFASCDLIVQCGAPVIWNGCSKCEWNQPLWQDVVAPLSKRIPILNLAAGSAYPLSLQPEALEGSDLKFIQSILGYCKLTTARDRLAQKLMENTGAVVPLVPCSAGLALEPGGAAIETRGVVAVNYMKKAGHYDFRRELDADAWESTFRSVLENLKEDYKVIFLCHNKQEVSLATEKFPEYERVFPQDWREYNRFANDVRFGIFNRLHAAVAFAGIGIPSIAVGNDTRTLMVEEYALPVYDVRNCNSDLLLTAICQIESNLASERERLQVLRGKTFSSYLDLIAEAIK